MNRMVKVVTCAVCALVVGSVAVSGQAGRAGGRLSAETRAKLVESLNKAETYLRESASIEDLPDPQQQQEAEEEIGGEG